MEKPLFTICLIARQEAKVMSRALESLKEFRERGGEIVVVDTGSKDNTAEIARSYGCVVEEVGEKFLMTVSVEEAENINKMFVVDKEGELLKTGDRIFHFANARNYAADLASNDMISMMDADEIFTKLDIDAINQKIKEGYEAFEYHFVFSHDSQGNPGIAFTQSKMYHRRKQRWANCVHETRTGEAKTTYLDKSIFLLEHYQNMETNRTGYLRGLAFDVYLNPANDRNSHYFAREMFYHGMNKSAIKEFKRHIAMDKWPAERSQSYIFMGECYERMNQLDEAINCFNEAYKIEAGRRTPFWKLMEHYAFRGDLKRAVAYGEALLTIPYSGFYADDMALYTYLPHEKLYCYYWQLGDRDKSREHFNKAWKFKPLESKYLYDLRWYRWLPKISVIIPHLGEGDRRKGLERCIISLKASNYPQELIQTIVLEGEGTVPEKVAKGLLEAQGDYVVYAANDMEFTENALILAFLDSEREDKALVSFNAGPVYPDEGNINEHFIIRKDFIPQIGEIFCTRMRHCGVDNLLWAKCKKLNQAFHSELAKVNHHHFSKGAPMDEVYEKGWSHQEEDRKILAEELAKMV